MNFPTQEAKDQAAIRVFTELQSKYSGSDEGVIAQYYLGSIKADQGKLAEAEKCFQDVAHKADDKYASLAKLSLAQIYFADGRVDQGEKTLRELIANPTIFVSKEQATISLARYLAAEEARGGAKAARSAASAAGQRRTGGALDATPNFRSKKPAFPCWRGCDFRWNEAGAGDTRNRNIPIATRSNGTGTGSFIPARFDAWRPRRRCSRPACRTISAIA